VSLIKFSGTLHDIATVVADIERRQAPGPDDCKALQMVFSNACGSAAEFFEAVPGIEGAEKDVSFVRELKARFRSMDEERTLARREFSASLLSLREGG
jgi:hypothetical protein